MPYSGSLNDLRTRLQSELSLRPSSQALPWGNPGVMTQALRSLQRDLGNDAGRPPSADILQISLQKFVKARRVSCFTELKYICYGLTVPVDKKSWKIIDKSDLFNDLLGLVSAYEVRPKQFRRCYQGLLAGYFEFDRQAANAVKSIDNWHILRDYLKLKLSSIRKVVVKRGAEPNWLQTLYEHKNLLTDDACTRYAKGLKKSDSSELKAVCAALGIASSSWVWEETLMAFARAVCSDGETEFKNRLPTLLQMANGEYEIRLPALLSTKTVALAVTRYARCSEISENTILRDACLHWIGNPWIHRTAWDAHVNDEPARQMVNGWLKRRLIKDFFELLAQDGSADLRRLNYWLKWEPEISDMWFVLGADARENKSTAFSELRKRMTGRDRILRDNNHQNNAFVMRVGQLLIIEFGVTGNACYAFAASDFRTNLERKIFTISDLKQRLSAKRLSHQAAWENTFDYEIKRLRQSVPMSKGTLNTPAPTHNAQTPKIPSVLSMPVYRPLRQNNAAPKPKGIFKNLESSPKPIDSAADTDVLPRFLTQANFNYIKTLCAQNGVEWENNIPKNGALWILIPDRKNVSFAPLLDLWGFKYTEGKGFWAKDY